MKPVARRLRLALPNGLGGYANDRRASGHVMDDDRVGADASAIPNRHAADDVRARPDVDVTSQHRGVSRFVAANRHLVMKVDVRAATDALVDHDAVRVEQNEARTEIGAPDQ